MGTSNPFAFALRQWHVLVACSGAAWLSFAVAEVWASKPVWDARAEIVVNPSGAGAAAIREKLSACAPQAHNKDVACLWESASNKISLICSSRDGAGSRSRVSQAGESLRGRLGAGLKLVFEKTLGEVQALRATVAWDRSVSEQAAALATGAEALRLKESAQRGQRALAQLDLVERRLQDEDPAAYLRKDLSIAEAPPEVAVRTRRSREKISTLFLSSLLLSAFAGWVVHRNDTRFRTIRETQARLRLPVLGGIPRITAELTKDPGWPLRERAFVAIASGVERAAREGELRSILVTSGLPGEGRTSVAGGLASALATRGLRVVLVDVDLEHPALHRCMGVLAGTGLTDLLASGAGLSSTATGGARTPADTDVFSIACPTGTQGLQLIPAGGPLDRLGRLPTVEELRPLILRLARSVDLVICDAGALSASVCGQRVANCCDGALLVLEAGKTEAGDVARARSWLRATQAALFGVVLNKAKSKECVDLSPTRTPGAALQPEFSKDLV